MCSVAVALLAASMLRHLDPYTSLYQTDDDREGRALSSEPGWWPSANGQKDPLAKNPEVRMLYGVFRKSDKPFDGYDPEKPSLLFKVNQVGYSPDQPKFVYIGAWLGPKLGAWKPRWREEGGWEVVDAKTRKVVYASRELPLLRVPDAVTKEGTPFTGEETYEMDFSSVTNEGTYFVRVPGVGRSADFKIIRLRRFHYANPS